MHNLGMRWFWSVVVLSAGAACTNTSIDQAGLSPPRPLGWQRKPPDILHRLVSEHLRTREQLLGRSVQFTMCMPSLPPDEQNAVRRRLEDLRVDWDCRSRLAGIPTAERLRVESIVAEGDSVIMSALRFGPGAVRADWRESQVTFEDFFHLAMVVSSLTTTPQLQLPIGIRSRPDSLVLAYLAARRYVGVRIGSDALCIATADGDMRRRLGNTHQPGVRFAADCGRVPAMQQDVLDLIVRQDQSTATRLVVDVRVGSGESPREWTERFTLEPSGQWRLSLGGLHAVD
jgi:hypothetical protein